jgi:hypothetical protein
MWKFHKNGAYDKSIGDSRNIEMDRGFVGTLYAELSLAFPSQA